MKRRTGAIALLLTVFMASAAIAAITSINPSSGATEPGGTIIAIVNVSGEGTRCLSAGGVPPDVSVTFSPRCYGSGTTSVQMRVFVSAQAEPGISYTLTISERHEEGDVTGSALWRLTVRRPPSPDPGDPPPQPPPPPPRQSPAPSSPAPRAVATSPSRISPRPGASPAASPAPTVVALAESPAVPTVSVSVSPSPIASPKQGTTLPATTTSAREGEWTPAIWAAALLIVSFVAVQVIERRKRARRLASTAPPK